jgi:hypothetical protein
VKLIAASCHPSHTLYDADGGWVCAEYYLSPVGGTVCLFVVFACLLDGGRNCGGLGLGG